MPKMRVKTTTGWTHEVEGFQRLPAGLVLDVDDEVARRWRARNIAEDAGDLPEGIVTDQEVGMSEADIKAEMARLDRLLKRGQQQPQPAAPSALDAAEAKQSPLARYDLSEQQRTNLNRAGFTHPDRIDAASDADLLEVDGIGEAALAKLRRGRA